MFEMDHDPLAGVWLPLCARRASVHACDAPLPALCAETLSRARRLQQRSGHRRSDCPAQPARTRRCDHDREPRRARLWRLHLGLRLGGRARRRE